MLIVRMFAWMHLVDPKLFVCMARFCCAKYMAIKMKKTIGYTLKGTLYDVWSYYVLEKDDYGSGTVAIRFVDFTSRERHKIRSILNS